MASEKENSAPPCRIFCWRPAAWLKVTGADSLPFLQAQFSNDLRALEPGRAVYGLWLDLKAHVQADSFVLRGSEGEFWLASYFSPAEAIRTRLESYIISDDVTVEDGSSEWVGLTVLGAAPIAALAAFGDRLFRFDGRRSTEPALELLYPRTLEPAIRALFAGVPELTRRDMELRRIAAGIPAVPADIGPRELPNEAAMEAEAISYTKGCYLGQEVIARLRSMGKVRRRLLRVGGSGPLPALPAPLFQAGRKLGELRTAIGSDGAFVGLALLLTAPLQRDQRLGFSAEPDTASPVRIVGGD